MIEENDFLPILKEEEARINIPENLLLRCFAELVRLRNKGIKVETEIIDEIKRVYE